jgi:hypothetical protein
MEIKPEDRPSVTALVKPAEVDGRVIVRRLVLAGEPVNSAAVSRFPVGWVEGVLNMPWLRSSVIAEDASDDVLTPALEAALVSPGTGGIGELVDFSQEQSRPKLGRPNGRDPDSFYRLVATVHAEAVSHGLPPAPTLASEAQVPVRTVHGWIREARRRGFLPPTRRGTS